MFHIVKIFENPFPLYIELIAFFNCLKRSLIATEVTTEELEVIKCFKGYVNSWLRRNPRYF